MWVTFLNISSVYNVFKSAILQQITKRYLYGYFFKNLFNYLQNVFAKFQCFAISSFLITKSFSKIHIQQRKLQKIFIPMFSLLKVFPIIS